MLREMLRPIPLEIPCCFAAVPNSYARRRDCSEFQPSIVVRAPECVPSTPRDRLQPTAPAGSSRYCVRLTPEVQRQDCSESRPSTMVLAHECVPLMPHEIL